MDVTIEPLDEFVVVQPIADETETRAGPHPPRVRAEAAPCRTGIVTAVGSDANGVEAGDKVLYPRDVRLRRPAWRHRGQGPPARGADRPDPRLAARPRSAVGSRECSRRFSPTRTAWACADRALVVWVFVWLLVAVRVLRRTDLGVGGKIVWILVILLVPILGLFVYFLWDAARPRPR